MLSFLSLTFALAIIVVGVVSWLYLFWRGWLGLKSLATKLGITLGW